jgi:hypothetical protein
LAVSGQAGAHLITGSLGAAPVSVADAAPSGSLKVMAEAKVKRPGGKETQCPTPADPASAAMLTHNTMPRAPAIFLK